MNGEVKRQHVSQWAKISLDIKSDAKWYVIKRVIKKETGRDFRATDICNLFMQYCFASKKARRPVDVRTLVFDRELLLHDETVASVDDIDILNQYFVRIELLTRRFTIANYYKWNDGDELQTSASGANINRKHANSFANQNANTANDLQTELQTFYKPTSRTHSAEYTQRYRLLKKQKSLSLTPNEAVELESLNNFFANANPANTANDLQTNASKMQTCKQAANTPIEKEEETEKELEKDFDNKKTNKKDSDVSRFQKPSIEEITKYCTQRQNTVDAESFYHHYEAVGWKVGNKPMKSWQSCVITREKRNNSQANQNSNSTINFSKGYEHSSINIRNESSGREVSPKGAFQSAGAGIVAINQRAKYTRSEYSGMGKGNTSPVIYYGEDPQNFGRVSADDFDLEKYLAKEREGKPLQIQGERKTAG